MWRWVTSGFDSPRLLQSIGHTHTHTQASDANFRASVCKVHAVHRHLELSNPSPDTFRTKHYAGEVCR